MVAAPASSRTLAPSPIVRMQYAAPSSRMSISSQRGAGLVRFTPRSPRVVQAAQRAPRALVVLAAGQPLRVMIAGAPAAGKGTQCAKIVEKYGLVHISVGDLLRAEVAAGTSAGLKAKSFMDNGDLVPNEVVVEMVQNKLGETDVQHNGWLLDGYPRSGEQAEAIEKEGIRPDVFLLINVPDELLIDRVVGRRSDPVTGEIYHLTFKPPPADVKGRLVQRSDDTEEKARNRLWTYHANVDAVVGYYEQQLVEIDGTRSMDEVFASIQAAIDAAARAVAA
ncbi:adenylate kinase [Micractinium conductrix]|uniref:adenylate kinase n=1 Tax=Micractinium conductrix TaxID=554055 RepID=A0A2P6VK05_9CHLO|nr:adenylate kinase [Micractinium conductrix]|eukprot:PSC74423.1 adenylate kinase [Micractinium conductrix]